MPIQLPDKCLRDYDCCKPLAQVASDTGKSFNCCGLNDGSRRVVEQDKFTLCFENGKVSEESHCDRRDLTDFLSVIAQALSVDANMEYNDAT